MRARQGSGSTSPSEGGSPQVYLNVLSELSNLIRSTHSTAESSSEPVVAHWQEGDNNGNNETSIEVPPPLDTDSPWYRGNFYEYAGMFPDQWRLQHFSLQGQFDAAVRHF